MPAVGGETRGIPGAQRERDEKQREAESHLDGGEHVHGKVEPDKGHERNRGHTPGRVARRIPRPTPKSEQCQRDESMRAVHRAGSGTMGRDRDCT